VDSGRNLAEGETNLGDPKSRQRNPISFWTGGNHRGTPKNRSGDQAESQRELVGGKGIKTPSAKRRRPQSDRKACGNIGVKSTCDGEGDRETNLVPRRRKALGGSFR